MPSAKDDARGSLKRYAPEGETLACGWVMTCDTTHVRLAPGTNRWPLGLADGLANTVSPGETPGLVVAARPAVRLGRPASPMVVVRVVRHLVEVARTLELRGQELIDVDPFALLVLNGRQQLGVGALIAPHETRVHVAPEVNETSRRPPSHGGPPDPNDSVFRTRAASYAIAAATASVIAGRYITDDAERLVVVRGVPVGGLPQVLSRCLNPNPARRFDLGRFERAIEGIWVECQPRRTARAAGFAVGYRTTAGLSPKRPRNEDASGWRATSLRRGERPDPVLVSAVADGIGGLGRGDGDASKAAVAAFLGFAMDEADVVDEQAQVVWTRRAAEAARRAVASLSPAGPSGTTLSAVVIVGRRVTVAHIGDARVYLLGYLQPLQQLTTDHTVAAALVAGGLVEEGEADGERNLLTRALLTEGDETVRIDSLEQGPLAVASLEVRRGDSIVLCTDGAWSVSGALNDPAARRAASPPTASLGEQTVAIGSRPARGSAVPAPDPQELADRIIRRSLRGGGRDNATVLVLQV